MNKLILISSMLLLSGCQTALKNMAAGETGCMPDDIKILVEPAGAWSMQRQKSYVVECSGVKYVCSYAVTEEAMRDVHCKEMKPSK